MTDLATAPLPAAYEQVRASPEGLALFANPLVAILVIASLVSAALGDPVSATIIILMVGLSVGLNLFQSYRSQRAAARLREEVAPTATVRRDGTWAG